MHNFELVFSAILLMTTTMGVIEASGEQDASADKIVYDQRQSGKYNIHVSIKDVAIIEMDQNEIENQPSNEDYYYYDDNDLTVKPIKMPTTTTTVASLQSQTPSSTIHSEVETESSTLPANVTFSQNLLADIAATHASNNPQQQTTTPKTTTKATNVVIMESNSRYNSPTSTHLPQTTQSAQTFPATIYPTSVATAESKAMPSSMPFLSGRTKDIPIRAVNEPNSRIVKVKVQRNQQHLSPTPPIDSLVDIKQTQTGQHPQQTTGGAWGERFVHKRKRSSPASSILRKIFGMLVSLPFASERGHHHHHVASASAANAQYYQTKH